MEMYSKEALEIIKGNLKSWEKDEEEQRERLHHATSEAEKAHILITMQAIIRGKVNCLEVIQDIEKNLITQKQDGCKTEIQRTSKRVRK